jgi:hypothetical protein
MSRSENYPRYSDSSDVNPKKYSQLTAMFLVLPILSAIGVLTAFFIYDDSKENSLSGALVIFSFIVFFIGVFGAGIVKLWYSLKRYGWSGVFDENEALRVSYRNAIRDTMRDKE